MPRDDRYVDCEKCGQRFSGENNIRAYTRTVEVPVPGEADPDFVELCVSCLDPEREAELEEWKRDYGVATAKAIGDVRKKREA